MKLTRRSAFSATCLCLACLEPGPLLAEAPMQKSQPPAFYRLLIGDFEVTVLSDGTSGLPATKLLQGDPARIIEMLKRNFLADEVATSDNAFLVNTGQKLVLIDTGSGTAARPGEGAIAQQPARGSCAWQRRSYLRTCIPTTSAASSLETSELLQTPSCA